MDEGRARKDTVGDVVEVLVVSHETECHRGPATHQSENNNGWTLGVSGTKSARGPLEPI